MVFSILFAASSCATSISLLAALILSSCLVSSTALRTAKQASPLIKRGEPQCLDGYGWADFHDCAMAIEMLSIEIPQNLLGQPEKFEFLGVGATPRFPSYRSIQTPLKKTSGLCIANILVLDRGPREVHQSSDLASRMEVEDAAYRIVAECMLRQNAGGKMVIGENNDMAVLVYAVNSQFDRAEMILNIDAYHPQDWVQLLEDHVMNKAVTRIRVMQMAGQDTSGSGEASTSTTQQCSTGYSKSPDSCCLDYSFSWKAMAANAVQLVLGTFSILVDGKYGWCEFVTSAMELTVQSTKRDLPAPLSKRTVPRPICENHFGTPHPAACFDALTDMDFFEDITDGAEYDIAQQQILEFLAPYASPRFPQYRSAQTPRAWAFDECEVAVMWRWNGRPYSDLATEKQVSDGGAQVVRSCVLWGSGGYQVVGAELGIAIYLYHPKSHFKTIMDQLIAGQRKCDNPTNPLGLCTEPYFPELDFDPNEPGPSGSSPTGPSLPPKPPPVNQGKNKDKTCSRGYGYSPADCCEDRLYDWTAVYEKLMNVLIGTTVILNEGLLGWCADVGGST